jgi:hypothetical protein
VLIGSHGHSCDTSPVDSFTLGADKHGGNFSELTGNIVEHDSIIFFSP